MEKYESSDHAAKLNDTHPSFEFPETTGQRPESDRNRQHKSRRGHSVHHCRFEIRVRGDLEEERCIPQHQRTRCKESREREKQSRRSFLKGAGFGAASLAAAGIAGCSPSSTTTTSEVPADNGNKSASDNVSSASWREAPAPITEADIAETVDCDVLVVGLGYSGCAAFRAAAESGAKVIAVEAQAESDFAILGMGHFGHINSEFLKERGVNPVDPIEFLNNWQLRAANRSNASLCRKFTNTCGEAFDWYIDCLTPEERSSIEIQFFPTDAGYTTFKNGLGTYIGTASTMPLQEKIIGNMLQVGLDAGAQIYWGCPAEQLVQGDDGRVIGAVAKKEDGSYLKINAEKGVIVTAGDYSGNPEMAKDLLSQITNMLDGGDGEVVSMGYKGDGLKLCYWAGGQIDPYQATMGGDYYYPCDSPMDPIGSAAALWVNADGKRYSNEGFGFMEWAAYAGTMQPQGKIATVFDSNYEALIKAQPACHMGIDYPNGGMDALPDLLAAAVAGGPEGTGPDSNPVVYAANDYETLGTYLGYEGETLDNFVASIERYNQLCEIGLDEDFGKEKQLMIGVTQPPYYAYAGEKTIGHMLCNSSGIAIDENGQVLSRADYRPIPGLFAAGNTAGSRFGIQYTTALCGVSISFAVTQGKFTGEYVASLV